MTELDSITMVTLPMSELERVAGKGYVEYLRTMCVYPKQPDPERARLVAEIDDVIRRYSDVPHFREVVSVTVCLDLLRRCREALSR